MALDRRQLTRWQGSERNRAHEGGSRFVSCRQVIIFYQPVMPIHAANPLRVSERRRSARARVSTVSATIG